jgi:hypothetical protein
VKRRLKSCEIKKTIKLLEERKGKKKKKERIEKVKNGGAR